MDKLEVAARSRRLPAARPGDPLGLGFRPGERPATPPPPSPPPTPPPEKTLTGAEVRGVLAREGWDPPVLAWLDARLGGAPLFLTPAGSDAAAPAYEAHTRAELCASFPFAELGIPPEAVFARQELSRQGNDWVARDEGDEDAFTIMDTLRPRDAAPPAPPAPVVRTSIYVGREAWADFLQLARVARGAARVAVVRGATPAAALVGVARLALGE